MYILVVAVIVVAALVIFSVQNAAPVSVAFLTWKFGASLAVIVFLSFVIGIVVAVLSTLALRVKRAARRRTLNAEPLKKGRTGSSDT